MKKICSYLGMLATVALAFSSCVKENELSQPNEDVTHIATISIGKAIDTKTMVVEGETEASYKWLEDDNQYLHVYENGTAGTITDFSLNADKTVATLTVSFTGTPTAPYTYTAKYAKTLSESKKNPLILNEQNPDTDSFDPAADVLVSKATDDVTNLTERATVFTFTMGRVITVNKMTLTGLTAGEVVNSVEFTLDKHMAGYVSYDSENNNYSYSNGGTKLTMKYTVTNGVVPSNGQFPVYFVSAPVEAAGIVSVVVTTDQHVYTKSNTLDPNPFDGKTITFAIGTMKRFTMALSGYGEEVSDGVVYTLVESADDLYDGATYLIVGTDVNYAAGLFSGGNNHTAVSIEKTVNAQNKSIITIDNTVTVEPVLLNQVGSNWTIKNNASGNSYYGQYLICATGDYNRLQETNSESSALKEWTISISSGVATIVNANSTAKRTQIYYNQNGTSPMFACYAPGQTNTNYHTIALYVDKTTCVELEEAGLAYNVSSPVEVVWDNKESFVKPTLANPNNLAVSYASSAPAVATVDAATGEVTFVGNGTTTITASSAKTDTYKAGKAEYQITVTGAPVAKGKGVENPFTAEDAIGEMDSMDENVVSSEYYYVEGTIDAEPSYFGSGKLTFTFVDENNNQIKAYNCLGLDGDSFTAKSDLGIGDYVIVYGNLERYVKSGSTTYEVVNGQLAVLTKAPYFTVSELSASTIAYTGGSTITFKVNANVAWTASIDNSASLKIGEGTASTSVSGEADATVTVVIPENEVGATYTISFTTTSDKVTAPDDLEIMQTDNSVVVSYASVGDVLWSEDFSGVTTQSKPETGNSKTVVWNGSGSDVSYSYKGSSCNVYVSGSASSGGTVPELLIGGGSSGQANSTSWTVSGIPSGGAQSMSLSFKSNHTYAITGTGITVGAVTKNENTVSTTLSNPTGDTFTLVFTNAEKGNSRVDDFVITVTTAHD